MPGFLSSFRNLFSDESAARTAASDRLRSAMTRGVKLELQPSSTVQSNPPLLALTIESVDDNGFVVNQPVAEISRHLKKGRAYTLGFFDEAGRLIGETTCLGRTTYQDDRNRKLYSFRFGIPKSLRLDAQPQTRPRGKSVAVELEAELNSFDLRSPIFGTVIHLGKHNSKIRCQNALNKLRKGQDVYLKMKLPPPVGLLTEMVRITDVLTAGDDQELEVALTFHSRVQRLETLLEEGGLDRITRKAG